MTRSCNYIGDNNVRCTSTYQLHELFFRDPFDSRNCDFIELCGMHYDMIMKELNEELVTMKRHLDNKIWEERNQRKVAKENDVIYQFGALQYTIESLKERYKKMAVNQCRNYFCKASLLSNDKTKKIYSVTTFRPSGRRQYTFYLCALKCFNIIKGKCGMTVPINTGQMTMELV